MTTERDFNRLSIAVMDFEKAIEYAEEALRPQPSPLAREALVFAAIVCYARPFTRNEKSASSKAAPRLRLENFAPLAPDLLQLHELCKDLRNRALAHSEWDQNPTRFRPQSRVIASRPFALLNQPLDVRSLIVLTRHLLDECHHKRADYIRKLPL